MLLLYCLHCWLKTNIQHIQFEVSVSRIAFVWHWNLPLDSKMYLRGYWLKEFPQGILDCKTFYYIPFIKNIFLSISNKMIFETIKWLKWSFICVKGIIIILEHLRSYFTIIEAPMCDAHIIFLIYVNLRITHGLKEYLFSINFKRKSLSSWLWTERQDSYKPNLGLDFDICHMC